MEQPQSNPPVAPMHQYAPDALELNHGDAVLIDPNDGERHKYHKVGGHPDACQTIASRAPNNRSPRYQSK